jgi:hypothetical protein
MLFPAMILQYTFAIGCTSDNIVPRMTLGHIFAIITLDTNVAFDAVDMCHFLVSLQTSSPLMLREGHLWKLSVLQRFQSNPNCFSRIW